MRPDASRPQCSCGGCQSSWGSNAKLHASTVSKVGMTNTRELRQGSRLWPGQGLARVRAAGIPSAGDSAGHRNMRRHELHGAG